MLNMLNLVTWMSKDSASVRNGLNKSWSTHIYLDAIAGYSRTTLFDSLTSAKETAGSWLFGANLKVRFRNYTRAAKPFAVEVYAQTFWINPVNNWANYDLNSQYHMREQRKLSNNKDKAFTIGQAPYHKLGVLGIYEIGEHASDNNDKKGNEVFISLGYTTNLSGKREVFYSNYFQAQVGLSINISDLLKGGATKPDGTDASGQKPTQE
jgi:hypothetical protein